VTSAPVRFEPILEWYSGKARDTIVSYTIPALVECEQLGYWKKGAARTVRATLNKQNVAAKWARGVEKTFGTVQFGSLHLRHDHPLSDAQACLLYGSFERAPRLLLPLLKTTFGDAERPYAEDAIRWAVAFSPVADLIALLDARRPKAVVVMKTLSPTVAQNVGAHIGLDVSTIQIPPMHGEWVEFVVKGQKCRVYEVVVDWPDGTLHDRSRFVHSANNEQCQACGHAIKNPFNWVPILAYDAEKVPHSLWVGRDCAGKLFGCEVEGDAIYAGRR
jgi:hypothetical protein